MKCEDLEQRYVYLRLRGYLVLYYFPKDPPIWEERLARDMTYEEWLASLDSTP